jgi:hypothetical protein
MRIALLAVGAFGWKIIAGVLIFVGALTAGHAVLGEHAASQKVANSSSNLTIIYKASPSSQISFKVSCLPHTISGTHPNKRAICAAIAKQGSRLFARVPKGIMCSQIYGGPETATITGTALGRKINATYSRTDGCQVARWNTASAFFTFPGYTTVTGRIEVSPTCPGPVHPGQNCTNPSVAGTVTFTANLKKTVKATAVADRGFSVLLPTGPWTATASTASAMGCTPTAFTVPTTSKVVISCDTGIR